VLGVCCWPMLSMPKVIGKQTCNDPGVRSHVTLDREAFLVDRINKSKHTILFYYFIKF
jgi:hypothetical protein